MDAIEFGEAVKLQVGVNEYALFYPLLSSFRIIHYENKTYKTRMLVDGQWEHGDDKRGILLVVRFEPKDIAMYLIEHPGATMYDIFCNVRWVDFYIPDGDIERL